MIGSASSRALYGCFAVVVALLWGCDEEETGSTLVDVGDAATDPGADLVADAPDAHEEPDVAVDASADANAAPQVFVNEVVATPLADGVDWVEIYNPGDQPVPLGGWTLTDDDPEHVLLIAAGTEIDAGGFLVLERDDAGSFAFGLGDDDAVFLYDADGGLVDLADWDTGEAPLGRSYGRFPDGTGAFATLDVPTPGEPNRQNAAADCGNDIIEATEVCDGSRFGPFLCLTFGMGDGDLACVDNCQAISTAGCTPPGPGPVINEVTAAGDDAIELYNSSDSAVDLAGWWIEDDDPTHQYVLPAGTNLAPGAYLVLHRDVDHAFGLGGDDAVYLFDALGNVVDAVDWLDGQAELSYCRIPDGEGPFGPCDPPTFGAANPN